MEWNMEYGMTDDPLSLCSQKGAVISIDPGLLEGQDQRATCMALPPFCGSNVTIQLYFDAIIFCNVARSHVIFRTHFLYRYPGLYLPLYTWEYVLYNQCMHAAALKKRKTLALKCALLCTKLNKCLHNNYYAATPTSKYIYYQWGGCKEPLDNTTSSCSIGQEVFSCFMSNRSLSRTCMQG